jgi:biopolymer transport protein ExbB/TolQ
MNLTSITDFLHWISSEGLSQITSLLRYPVLIVLFGFTIWVIIETGMIAFEWVVRAGRFHKKELKDLEEGIQGEKLLLETREKTAITITPNCDTSSSNAFEEEIRIIKDCMAGKFVQMFLNGLSTLRNDAQLPIRLERLLQACDAEVSKRVERTRAMVRIGPMLGLMGTLIPMGPALLALTQGDVDTLAFSLIYAFGTTVLGLLVGVIAYVLTTVRQHWYDRDMDDIRYICEMLFGGE